MTLDVGVSNGDYLKPGRPLLNLIQTDFLPTSATTDENSPRVGVPTKPSSLLPHLKKSQKHKKKFLFHGDHNNSIDV
jgi:hypothetical protein